MSKVTRPVIAINEFSGERIEFKSVYAAAKGIGASHTQIIISIALGNAVYGWRVYDTPENIRKRIDEMERTIKMLNQ